MAKATFNPKRLLVVHAHPDDESLFTGHVIAEAVAAKAEVMVLTLTRGERGRMKLEDAVADEHAIAPAKVVSVPQDDIVNEGVDIA